MKEFPLLRAKRNLDEMIRFAMKYAVLWFGLFYKKNTSKVLIWDQNFFISAIAFEKFDICQNCNTLKKFHRGA